MPYRPISITGLGSTSTSSPRVKAVISNGTRWIAFVSKG